MQECDYILYSMFYFVDIQIYKMQDDDVVFYSKCTVYFFLNKIACLCGEKFTFQDKLHLEI